MDAAGTGGIISRRDAGVGRKVWGVLCLLPFFLIACGDSADYRPNVSGGADRSRNFSDVSLSGFTGFSETVYDSLGAGFLGPPLPLSSDRLAVITTDRRLALIRYNVLLRTFQFPDGKFPLSDLASDSLGTVYVATTDGELHAVDSAGTLRWGLPLGGSDSDDPGLPLAPLTVPGGVVCGTTSGWVGKFDPEGKDVWSKTFRPGLVRSPAFGPEVGIALGVTGNNYDLVDTLVLLGADGEETGRMAVGGRIEYGPIIVGERVVIGGAGRTEEGKYRPFVLSVDKEGKEEWRTPLQVLPTGIAADDDGNIYVCGGGGGRISGGSMVSLDVAGKVRWEIGLQRSVPIAPVIGGDLLCFLGMQEGSIGTFIYSRDGTFHNFAPVESLAEITLPPTVLPDGSFVIACSSEPIILKSRGGGFLGL